MPYEDVDYWPELCEIMHWSETCLLGLLYLLGGSGGDVLPLRSAESADGVKVFGVFSHKVELPRHPLVRGFDENSTPSFKAHRGAAEDIEKVDALKSWLRHPPPDLIS